jgi:hypothetical protein
MDANMLGLSFLGILTLYVGYIGWSNTAVIQPINLITPWGEDTGKTHHSQSKTGDASMVTELRRRQAIQQVGRINKYKLKESRTQFGSTTGAVETFMLSTVCPPHCPPICPSDAIYDGGDQSANYCPILDDQGDGPILNAGDHDVIVCGQRVCPSDMIFDGGNQANEFCPILDHQVSGTALDAGNRDVIVCGQRICPSDMIFDGGDQSANYCPILDHQVSGTALDAGNQNTKACGI